ncbi:hypothetical protein BDZ97DRAFT_1923411 [Flammula alnicola]|nr:hypothetical protein BDZ97DRAFT_1923411 [Flammula alnicola]
MTDLIFQILPVRIMPPTVAPTVKPGAKRIRKMSKRKRRALDLPSDSAAGSSSSGGEESDEVEDGDQPESSVSEVTSLMLQPPALHRSQSSASLASQHSVTVSSTKTDDQRHAKFDERYKTATSSDKDVLKKQMDQWTADVYKHFKMPPAISVNKGVVIYIFTCIA